MGKTQMHLYRGAPCVRAWSKYQETVERWTLCGIDRRDSPRSRERAASATKDASLVDCRYCLLLMRTGALSQPKALASSA